MSGKLGTFLGRTPAGKRCRPGLEELESRTLLHAALTATGIAPVSMLAGFHYTGVVATFTDPGMTKFPSNVTVTVNWGDGTPSQQTLDLRPDGHTPGLFHAWAGHTFETGRTTPYTLSVQVRAKGGAEALATSLFHIDTPAVSLHLQAGRVAAGSPVGFRLHASDTPGGKAPTSYLLEYQAPGETIWHTLSQGPWETAGVVRGAMEPAFTPMQTGARAFTPQGTGAGGFDLAGTVRLPKAGRFFVRALATVGPIQYPSGAVEVSVR